MSTQAHHSNLAARMGRWSAAHWKTATFGWLALVVVAFGVGGRGRHEEHRSEHAGPGPVGPHGQDPRRRVQAARGRERPDPEPLRSGRRRPPSTPRSTTSSARLEADGVAARPARPQSSGERRHAALVEFDIRGDKTKAADKSRRSSTRVAERAACASRLLHRRVRRRQRGRRRSTTAYAKRPRERRHALDPAHADHPRRSRSARSWRRASRCCSR